ncbi:MAG: molybdopterin-dependent oxidoreductase [Chloroflexota bacterium]|nr:molybdopterin-dependent oxidoreductase [Chloroflexota bacterium]
MRNWWPSALAGLAGAGAGSLALGTGELAAGLLDGPSPIAAIGAVVIDLQPPGAKDFVVALFGDNDKLALEVATASGGIVVGALLGLVARRDYRLAAAGFVAFGAVALMAALRDPLVTVAIASIVVAAAVGAGIGALRWLLPETVGVVRAPDSGRRQLVLLGATALVFGGVLAVVGRWLTARAPTVSEPAVVPHPRQTLPPPPAAAAFTDVDGLSPLIVPNDQFYRIDTRLSIPRLAAPGWRIGIGGLVDRPFELNYEELVRMPLVERYVTIACVSNEVGGELVGNAKWAGVPLLPLLERAGIRPEATQVVGRSFDGWTAGFPTEHLRGAGGDAMIALLMNGELLPPAHGFPARLIVPGLFGYVSATKWLSEIELTRWEDFDAYWVPLGWAKEGPILTQSRIDVPRNGGRVAAGRVTVAGVAWAPTRGISAVEVQVGDGAWQPAQLSVPLADAAWVQWKAVVELAAGQTTLTVRASDGTGALQEERRTPPAPDGARGWHRIHVNVA